MWGLQEQDAFAQDGLVTLKGAFTRAEADRMSDAIWTFVERRTEARRDQPATWPTTTWVGTSLKKLKRHSAFSAVLDSADTRGALDGIFGVGSWEAPRSGAQILLSFPNTTPETWRVPSHLWHMDTDLNPEITPTRAVKLFSVVEPLLAHGGATMAIAGTPRLQADFARGLPSEERRGDQHSWRRFLTRTDPWLARFAHDDGDPRRNEELGEPRIVAGQPVQLHELGGAPGDVHVTHINLFHSTSPNASERPRVVVTHVVRPVDPAT